MLLLVICLDTDPILLFPTFVHRVVASTTRCRPHCLQVNLSLLLHLARYCSRNSTGICVIDLSGAYRDVFGL